MRGIIFTELVDFIERSTSLTVAEEIIEGAGLAGSGAFTGVGNYPHTEAIKLVVSASEKLGVPANDLMRQFGKELFGRLKGTHPQFFGGNDEDTFSFLARVQSHIHAEVKKLYPDSSPPTVEAVVDDGSMTVTYKSDRPFAFIALGLIEGCCEHFDEQLQVEPLTDLSESPAEASFRVSRVTG